MRDFRARRHLKVGDEDAWVSGIVLTPINITLPRSDALYSLVTDSGDRTIDLDDIEDDDILTVSDEDLREEPSNDLEINGSEVVARARRDVVGDVVGDIIQGGAQAMMSGGNIKDFAFALLGPILKSLNRDNNVHAVKGLTRRFLPQTGFQSHPRGEIIRKYVQQGHLQQAVDVMAKHRTRFNVDGLYDRKESRTSEVYKGCFKILPHVDSLLTERLKSQTSVSTSLMQALFSEVKSHLKVDMDIAAKHLNKLEIHANLLGDILTDLTEEEFNSRVGVFAMFALTLVVCGVAVWGIKKSHDNQEKMREELMRRIDTILERSEVVYTDKVKPRQIDRQTTRKQRVTSDANTSFDFAGEMTPPVGRQVLMLD